MSIDPAVPVASFAWDVLKWVVVPIKRQFGYVISSKSYAQDLQKEVEKLEYGAGRIDNAVERDRNNLRKVYHHVTQWQARAEEALKEARGLLSAFEQASKSCCYGALPDPNCRYQFSRKAKHKIEDIQELARECSEFRDISFIDPASGNVAAPTPSGSEGSYVIQSTTIATASVFSASTSVELRDDGVFKSRALMIRKIMDALADNSISVVGVHGMGGLGKSTLLVDIEKRIRKENSFDWVAKADVSKNPNIEMIQGEIAEGLELTDIESKKYIRVRAKLLRNRLKAEERSKKKVLIILDNLWEGLDLKSVGIPCGHDNKVTGCKLLLTSRDRDVLQRDMGCDKAFPLGVLEQEEARGLFERMVGDKARDDEFRPLLNEALDRCAGLPFLIVQMANLLKHADSSGWRDALYQIEGCTNEGISAKINTLLQVSYDHLESEDAKSLLQLCAAYAVSEPSFENLLRYGFGLGIFRNCSSMEIARDRLGVLISTLQASSLLLEIGDGDGFKIHDLVRDFVAQFILSDHPLLVLKDKENWETELSKDKLKSCRAICFPYADMKELPRELHCPELRTFLLLTNSESLEVPDSLFHSMRNLMVLNLTGIHLICSPSPFQFSESLHTLCLQCCSLEDAAILGELKGLQILSIVDSKIRRLPKEIGQLVELRLLDLSRCSRLEIIEPGVLRSLTKLEELYMEDSSFDQWSAGEQTPPTNASLIELNHMKKLRTLHVSIPDPSVLPKDLDVEKLTKYIIRIGNVWRWSKYVGSRTLKLRLDPTSDVLRKECIQSILDKTDVLFLEGLNGTEQSICALSQEGFPKLKHLQVEDGPSVRYILRRPSVVAFKALETLLLQDLINLEKITNNNISTESFSTLKVVQVVSCDKMEVLFPHSVVRELPQLEELEVVGCKLMQGIVEANDDRGKFELSKLRVLKLRNLPNIENFFTAGSAPSSSTSDDQVGTQIAFFNGQQVAFPRLETLEINGLDNLGFMFSQYMVKSLTQLRNLEVRNCMKMEAVIMEEEGLGVEISETLAFPMLTNLHLAQLESLTCFSREKCSREGRSQDHVQLPSSVLFNREVAFPSLEKLDIKDMGNIEMIWDDQVAVDSFSKLNSLYVDHCNKLVNVVPSIVLGRLLSLERLQARSCGSLKVVFKFQPLNPLDGHSVAHSPLKELELFDLLELECVWDKELHRQVKFQCLRSVSVSQCLSLTSLFPASIARDLMKFEELEINRCGIVELIEKEGLEERSINVEAIEGPSHELKVILPFTSYFRHLKTLDVSFCDGLSNMFTPTMATNLVGLTKLRIRKCGLLTEVISDEGGREGHVVAFNQLKYIELDGLIGLRCFYSGGYTLKMPLLEEVIVTGCLKMKFFSEGPIEASKLQRVQVSKEAWFWKENLNITVQHMSEEMGTAAGVNNMLLSEFPKLIGKWHSELNPIKSSWQLKSLTVDKCPSFINAIPSRLMLVLKNMETLQVRDCESLEEIFDLEGLETVESTRVLPSFTTLDLVNLPKLRRLWNKDLQGSMRLNSLSSLTLYKCSSLRHAFVPSMARCLANLKGMEIKECGQMEGVIADEEGQGSVVEKTLFPNLELLKLECMPNLTSFLLGKNHTLECPILEELIITHCPKMRSLAWQSLTEIDDGTPSLFTPQVQFPRLQQVVLSHMDNLSKIWTGDRQETLTFDYLWKVEVQNCKTLVNLFPYWVATSLTQLTELQVESCGIEEIVASGNDTPHSTTAQVLFPELRSLVLHDMPRLKTFYPNLTTLNWPFLKELRVTHCDKVKIPSFAASMNKWTQRNDQQDLSDQEAHSSFEMDFPELEGLLLDDKDIRMIRDGKYLDDIFGKPKALTLACFHEENTNFPPRFLLERFQNLKSLEVFCSSFEDIFPDEGNVDEGKHSVLESLRGLKLSKLHKLKRVWREDYLVSKILRSIESFEVWDCPGLTSLFPAVTCFHNLTELVVKNSSGLVHLGTASAIASLVLLTDMTIIGCERMKEIVAKDENEEGRMISFGKLEILVLQDMPSLECFSSTTSCILRFPSLKYIMVEECLKMKIFSKGTLSTPMLSVGTLFRYNCYWDEDGKADLNRAIRELSA